MNVAWFLSRRLDFIRQFFARSSAPFVDRRTAIENGAAPVVPPYSEDGEPPFLLEWREATDSIARTNPRTPHKPHCRKLTEDEPKRILAI